MSGCAHMHPRDCCASCAPTKYRALLVAFDASQARVRELEESEAAVAQARREGAERIVDQLCALLDADAGPCCVLNHKLFVNCSDTFGYACADAEAMTHEDIPEVHAAHKADPEWGALLWVQKRRGGIAFLPELEARRLKAAAKEER